MNDKELILTGGLIPSWGRSFRFSNVMYELALAKGFSDLNVLCIGKMDGMTPVHMSNRYVYCFSKIKRSRGRSRPIDKLDEYEGLLQNKFDVVISREYDPEFKDFLTYKGIYVTKIRDSEKIEDGIVHKDYDYAIFQKNGYKKEYQDDKGFVEELRKSVNNIIGNRYHTNRVFVPDLDKLHSLKVDDEVVITHKGFRASRATSGLMAMMNNTMAVYNPLYTTYTGVIDAYQQFPSCAFVKYEERKEKLSEFGFGVKEEATAKVLSERLREKYEFLITPTMPLLPQQALAYVKEGDLKAKKSVPSLGVVRGRKYKVRVGWKKRESKELKKGFMTVTVNGETLWEDKEEDVQRFVDAFGLPKVRSMTDLYPDVIKGWRTKLSKMFPMLEDFQLDDLSLACTKPFMYLGHDRGLGKTLMSAAWAKARGYKRVLVATTRQYLDKWYDELIKFGFKAEFLLDWPSIDRLKKQIKAGIKNEETTFYLCSLEFMGHETDICIDPWTCLEKNKDGTITAMIREIKGRKCPNCARTVGQARKICPLCGSTDYSGRYCYSCKRPTYTYKREKPLTVDRCHEIEHSMLFGKKEFHSGTYPAYKRMKKLFSCCIIDEAQIVKNKNTLRSNAARSIMSKGKALVTANLMKNYPRELFWPVSWLLGFNNPMFPYKYKGGFPFFEKQFGTEILINKYDASKGKRVDVWKMVPEVSNLTILWKLMAPFMVRRIKKEMEGIEPPHIEAIYLKMDRLQKELYSAVKTKKLEELATELSKSNPDAHVIGANLWSLKAASTIPSAQRYFPPVDVKYKGYWPKLNWTVNKAIDIQKSGEKVLIYSTLVDMADYVTRVLQSNGVRATRIKQGTKNRFELIKRFNSDSTTALVSSPELIGKCFDIESASHVIFTDMGWTPEEHEQAMDRADRPLIATGQVNVYFLLSAGTIDEDMFELVLQKGEAIKNVLDRRAVYQPASILREAVQVQIAKRLIERRHTDVVIERRAVIAEPIKEIEVRWPDKITSIGKEQIDLFS